MQLLSELNRDSFEPSHIVALSDRGPLSWEDFLTRVDCLRSRFENHTDPAFALFENDTYRFAAALIALLAEGKRVFLPGENNTGTANALAVESAILVGDWPGENSLPLEHEESTVPSLPIRLCGTVTVFTSGSTSSPKAIDKTLRQIDAELVALEACFGEKLGHSQIYSGVSHQHLYGLLFGLFWPMSSGRQFWHQPFIDPTIMARAAAQAKASAWVSSPGHLHRLGHDMPWSDVRDKISAVFSSGGPLNSDAAENVFNGLGIYPDEVLGSSETGGIAHRRQKQAGSPWTPIPGVDVDASEAGNLKVRSPFLPDNEWFETGDQLLTFTEQGFLLGKRSDRIAKIEGKRISLVQVESVLEAQLWIREAYALVVERHRDVVGALVSLSEEGKSALTELGVARFNQRLRQVAGESLPPLGTPRVWRFCPYLPRNAQGKLKVDTVAPLFSDNRLPPVIGKQSRQNGCLLQIWVDRSSRYFEGHFPQNPVLPGVVQLTWVEALARRYLNISGRFDGLQGLKFKEIIRPNTLVNVDLDWDPARARLEFRLTSAGQVHSQGRLQF